MKTRFAFSVLLPLLLTFVALATLTAAAQEPAVMPPPVKMGLWQSESTTTVSGAPDTPMGKAMGNGHTTVTQGCLTPESWAKEMQGMEQRRHNADCTTSNFKQDSHRFSLDESCGSGQGYSSNVHFEMLIDDSENAHGQGDVKMTGPAFPQGMSMHMTMKTKFISSDCGDVKPGEGKTIR
jgi:Protein of unknown function (DUF3617)